MAKKTVVFDFDGVIHSYASGWKGAECIPDPPVPGIEKALAELHEAYEIAVVSSRCSTQAGVDAINHWLYRNGLAQYVDKVCMEKPLQSSISMTGLSALTGTRLPSPKRFAHSSHGRR